MTHTLTQLEKLISEAERRKKFLEQGVEALQQTLNEASAEIQRLKANADELQTPSADPTQTTRNESKE
jgi:phage shock protein A